MEAKEIEINGVKYIPKDSLKEMKLTTKNKLPYVIVRTYSAGVFAGYLKTRTGKEATILEARRLWYWKGASSLSQLAVDGTNAPNECKFPVAVEELDVTEAIEIIKVTEKARKSIESVKIWSQ